MAILTIAVSPILPAPFATDCPAAPPAIPETRPHTAAVPTPSPIGLSSIAFVKAFPPAAQAEPAVAVPPT